MKKLVGIVLVILMVQVMAGCANKDMQEQNSGNISNTQESVKESGEGQNPVKDNDSHIYMDNIRFIEPKQSLFAGKVREICCGADRKLLIRADKLYLYDASEGIVVAEDGLDEYQDVQMFAYESGYVVIGNPGQDGSGGFVDSTSEMKCICKLYNSQLEQKKEIVLSDLLSNDVIVSLNSIDVSSDGNKIIFATLSNVYLYQTGNKKCKKLLSINKNAAYKDLWISDIEYMAFVSGDKQIVFVGNSIPLDGGDSIPSYGMFDVTGKNLVILGDGSYSVDEMLMGNGFMYLPAVFNKADGTLLKYNFAGGEESSISFRNVKEGKDGVYTSFNGTYLATALLDGKLVLNIYDKKGVHLKEYVVDGLNAAYFYRIPQITLCEDSRVCIVVLGNNQMDIDTKIICFEF